MEAQNISENVDVTYKANWQVESAARNENSTISFVLETASYDSLDACIDKAMEARRELESSGHFLHDLVVEKTTTVVEYISTDDNQITKR